MKKIWVISARLVEYEQDLLYISNKEEAEKTLKYLEEGGDVFDYAVTECTLFETFDEVKKFLEKLEADVGKNDVCTEHDTMEVIK